MIKKNQQTNRKPLNTVGLEGIYFNMIKCYVTSPTVNIILSGEKL